MYKIQLLAVIFILMPETIYSQSTETPDRYSIGINFSADYCYRTVFNNTGNDNYDELIKIRNENETPILGYVAGFNLNYKLSSKFSVQTGLQYSKKGYGIKLKDFELFYSDNIDPRYGFVYDSVPSGKSLEKISLYYHYTYLDIPLQIKMCLGKKRIKFVAGVGIVTGVLLNATQTSVKKFKEGGKNRDKVDQQYDFRSISLSTQASAGVSYKLNEKINILIEPTIRYGLLKITDTPVSARLWSGGINFSCFYSL